MDNKEIISRLRAHAEKQENYESGWDIIVEATTDSELESMFAGDSDSTYKATQSIFPEYQREMPAATYDEAKRRVQRIVDINEERRREIQSTIW